MSENPSSKSSKVQATDVNIVGTAGKTALNVTAGNVVTASDVTLTSGNVVITEATKGIVHTNTGTVTQATSITTAVEINTTSGVITLHASAITKEQNVEFTVTNSTVKTTSVILVSVQDQNITDNAQIVAAVHTIASGSFKITLANPAATGDTSETASKVHFLVINPN